MAVLLAAVVTILALPMSLFLLAFFGSDGGASGGFVAMLVLVGTTMVVTVVGVPTFWGLRKLQREGWWSLAAAGAALGAVPYLFMGWPRQQSGFGASEYWHGRTVDLYVDGTPTVYAWYRFGESVAVCALLGAAHALVFYAVWRWLARPGVKNAPE